jgi:hypothetical protein
MSRPILRSFPGLDNTHISCDQSRKTTKSKQSTNKLGLLQTHINQRLILNVPLKTEADIEAAAKSFNDTVQWAGWTAPPQHSDALKMHDCPVTIKQKNRRKKKTPQRVAPITNTREQTVI